MDDRAGLVLGRLAPMIYGPTILFSLGEGAVIPLVPVIATNLGADVAGAGFIASALVVGQLVGNLPAGWLVARAGERVTMAIAGGVAMLGVLGTVFAPSLPVFAAAVFVIGFCAAAFGLARHSFMTTRVPLHFRARALSLLGGSFRLGIFVGPFIAAGLLAVFGTEHAALWFFAGCLAVLVVLVLFGPDPERVAPPGGEPVVALEREGVFRTMWRHRGVLSRLGVAAASLSAVRAARQVVLPLWGVSIGLDASTIALVVGVSGAIDFALFYASGQVMDRFGRLWAALPAMLLMAGGFLVLAFTHDVSGRLGWYLAVGIVLGLGNGLSSGILLTLGADVAPRADPAPFLGSWRTLSDAGGATAPVLVSIIAAAGSLAIATGAVGLIGLAGALAFVRYVPRFVPHARTSRRG
ncbi:putative transporter [Microbacterium ginsengisoli]|nr:MFS transporter [Microbacterium ginsengisoli]KJL35427.1 putative transporter [Microbacterium ginsengisoli]